jgi:alanine-synthesizing transaminase
LFPRLDPEIYHIEDDEAFVLDFLRQEKVLLVHGTAFNWPTPDHFRIVFLPSMDDLEVAIGRLDSYLARLREKQ